MKQTPKLLGVCLDFYTRHTLSATLFSRPGCLQLRRPKNELLITSGPRSLSAYPKCRRDRKKQLHTMRQDQRSWRSQGFEYPRKVLQTGYSDRLLARVYHPRVRSLCLGSVLTVGSESCVRVYDLMGKVCRRGLGLLTWQFVQHPVWRGSSGYGGFLLLEWRRT